MWILRARAQKIFLPYIEKKSFPRPGAVDPNVDSPRLSAENPGAVDPKVDSPRPSAENFLPYIEKKIVSAPGRGRSKCGFSAPERRKFSPLYRGFSRDVIAAKKSFCGGRKTSDFKVSAFIT